MSRGYFGIGIYHGKAEVNTGSLWRTASLYDAAFIFTIGRRYQMQASDTPKTRLHTPLFHYDSIDEFKAHLPWGAPLVGVELDPRAVPLPEFKHPERAVYLLGAEDHGLPPHVIDQCHHLVTIPSIQPQSMNVAVAGSLMIYDRFTKQNARVGVPA